MSEDTLPSLKIPTKLKVLSIVYGYNGPVGSTFTTFFRRTYFGADCPIEECKKHVSELLKDSYFLVFHPNEIKKSYTAGDYNARGVLVRVITPTIPIDTIGAYSYVSQSFSPTLAAFTRIESEVELREYYSEKKRATFKYVELFGSQEKAAYYRREIIKELERTLTKLGSPTSVATYHTIQSFESLLNAVFMILIISAIVSMDNNYNEIQQYYATNNLDERAKLILDILTSFNMGERQSEGGLVIEENKEIEGSEALTMDELGFTYEKFITGIQHITDEIRKELLKEARQLRRLQNNSRDADTTRSFLDLVCDIPWDKYDNAEIGFSGMRKKLDEMEYGVVDAKERLLEYLAVNKNMPKQEKGTVLCLAGPPGVGKTLFAQSVAHILGRKHSLIALGGIDDVTILRGQRRGWVGAEPGQIVKALIHAGSMNPVIILDEIDKITGIHGEQVKAALLEVLDPNQNFEFKDAYLDFPLDISSVVFIATANDIYNIPYVLMDRLEIIELKAYSPDEKRNITKKFLIPKVTQSIGLKKSEVVIGDDVVRYLLDVFRFDPGMRGIERSINKLLRRYLLQRMEHVIPSGKKHVIDHKEALRYIKLLPEMNMFNPNTKRVGEINMLFVSYGGDFFRGGGRSSIQVRMIPGTGKQTLTGSIQDVFKEAISVAIGYLESHAGIYGIEGDFFQHHDLFLHIPETAVKKDGPSAGMAITLGLLSAINNLPVPQNIGLTGEIDLEGNILGIGGIRMKILGGFEEGLSTFIIPLQNRDEYLRDVEEGIKKSVHIVYVTHIEGAIKHVFPQYKVKNQQS